MRSEKSAETVVADAEADQERVPEGRKSLATEKGRT